MGQGVAGKERFALWAWIAVISCGHDSVSEPQYSGTMWRYMKFCLLAVWKAYVFVLDGLKCVLPPHLLGHRGCPCGILGAARDHHHHVPRVRAGGLPCGRHA